MITPAVWIKARKLSAAMSEIQVKEVSEADLQELKSRMKLIADADPTQYHNDFSLKRYLRAFKTVDDAFKVSEEIL